jgi:F-box and leucine-rich repeat protein GRR1
VPQINNPGLFNIMTHSQHLRELRLIGNANIDDEGIPNLSELIDEPEEGPDVEFLSWYAKIADRRIVPTFTTFDSLRAVDLMSCSALNDKAIDNLICNAPRIRQLTLAKCPLLTDKALVSIARLGKQLHHLHLGHAIE